jgi:hypothetical protein
MYVIVSTANVLQLLNKLINRSFVRYCRLFFSFYYYESIIARSILPQMPHTVFETLRTRFSSPSLWESAYLRVDLM